jgi:TonB-dependent receptor
MHRKITILGILMLALAFTSNITLAASTGVEGYVKDATTGEPLLGANVILVGTSLGAAADTHGKYVISNVPAGTYTVRVTYIGYRQKEVQITIVDGTTSKLDFELEPTSVEGNTVVVTAQATGQTNAINQQLSSNRIVNVVSAARIQELPDANVAESVGRLPGISVLRSGGEGDEVVIRGLAPKYNQILVNGIELSSSNPFDRSTDLSMISSNMLAGIEVSKSVLPDMDANVIGGVVNFELREAQVKEEGRPQYNLLLQGGYNALSNAYNKLNNYKYVGSAEDRFLDDRFGIFAQVDIERKNLTSNELGAAYTNLGSTPQYLTTALNLYDIPRDRLRYNGALVMDYKLPNGKIKFSNLLSTGETTIQNRGETYNIQNNLHNYSLAYSNSKLSVISNSINYQQEIPIFNLDLKLFHSYSETKTPNDWTIGFQQASAGLSQFIGAANINPINIPKAANNDTSLTYLTSLTNNSSFSRDRVLGVSLDLKTNLNFSTDISSVIKFGGDYKYRTRSYTYDQFSGQGLGLISAAFIDSLIATHFPSTSQYSNTTSIPIMPYLDSGYNYGKFLGGDYPMILPLNFGMLYDLATYIRSNAALIQQRDAISYFHDLFNSTTNNYDGNEKQSAAYVMATVNIGPDITIIPGVRYQNLQTTYTAPRGYQNTASATGGGPYQHIDTTVTVSHPFWLPDVSVRYKPFSWFDIRLSYTNTLAYPDYNAIVPRIDLSTGSALSWNNYQLVPSKSKNFDAYLSFYNNTIGLFTVGGYLKYIDNLIYPWTFAVRGAAAAPYFPPVPGSPAPGPSSLYLVSTYINDPHQAKVRGIELDWQTHFWYLPQPFDGLVLSINYTHVYSEAQYPYTRLDIVGRVSVYTDTVFTDRLLYQPNNIANISLGYDYKGFSVRVSMLYQDDIFTGPNYWAQLRSHTSSYTRWDIAAKQELPWFGIQLYGDLNNINGSNDVSVIQAGSVPQSQQDYGMTGDLGVRINF